MTRDGHKITRFWLTDGLYRVGILTLGGIIQSMVVPDRNGAPVDIVLGFDRVQDYENQTCYIGALLGRCANRIAGGEITIGGERIHLMCNDNESAICMAAYPALIGRFGKLI